MTPTTLDIDFLASDLVRSPGLHASDIYSDLYKHLDPKRYDYGDKAPNPILMALGTAWEKHFEYLLAKSGIVVERPQEFMSSEGIAFSPDLIQFNGVTRLWEIKYTSMSAKGLPTEQTNCLPKKFDKYDTQMKLYAYWLGLNHGCLAVVLNHQPWDPQFRMFDLEWTDRELAENHAMLMNHRQQMKNGRKK